MTDSVLMVTHLIDWTVYSQRGRVRSPEILGITAFSCSLLFLGVGGVMAEGLDVGRRSVNAQGSFLHSTYDSQEGGGDSFLAGNNACFVTAEHVKSLFATDGKPKFERPYIVDVRVNSINNDDIENSLRIPLDVLSETRFLMKKPFVLVGDGLDHAELESVCLNLRKSGFEWGFVLRGGAPAWQYAQYGKEGIRYLTVQSWVLSMRKGASWMLLLDERLSREERELVTSFSRSAMQVNVSVTSEKLALQFLDAEKKLSSMIREEPEGFSMDTAILLVSSSSLSPEFLNGVSGAIRNIQRSETYPKYVLERGEGGFISELHEADVVRDNAKRKLPVGCGRS